jgi:hypothetical protein
MRTSIHSTIRLGGIGTVKHQYYGDINDFWTYGLLRVLQQRLGWSMGVCWMLTPPDGRNDGNKISYLDEASRYQPHDPMLFQALSQSVRAGRRCLSEFAQAELLNEASYFADPLPLAVEARAAYWRTAEDRLDDRDLVFFDPDNGLEISSVQRGQKNSDKYLWLDEAQRFYARGQRLLLFQHFPRTQREPYLNKRCKEIRRAFTGSSRSEALTIASFSHAHVSFLLVLEKSEHAKVATAFERDDPFFGHLRWH